MSPLIHDDQLPVTGVRDFGRTLKAEFLRSVSTREEHATKQAACVSHLLLARQNFNPAWLAQNKDDLEAILLKYSVKDDLDEAATNTGENDITGENGTTERIQQITSHVGNLKSSASSSSTGTGTVVDVAIDNLTSHTSHDYKQDENTGLNAQSQDTVTSKNLTTLGGQRELRKRKQTISSTSPGASSSVESTSPNADNNKRQKSGH